MRLLFFLSAISPLLVIANQGNVHQARQNPVATSPGISTPTIPVTTPTTPTTPNTPVDPTIPPTSPTPTPSTPTSPTDSTETTSSTTSSTSSTASSSSNSTSSTSSSTTQSGTSSSGTSSTSTSQSTVTAIVTNTESSSASASSESATQTGAPSSSSEPVGKGTIIGLSVAGGIALLGIVGFIVWKVTRKRFSDFDADGEEIKWPELNNETHALPTRTTGRAGIDDDGDEVGLGAPPRDPSVYGAASSTAGMSMADVGSSTHSDPYAVPPLPHLNPNQPYRDDPTSASNYYDPYRGPIPQSLHDPLDGSEAIPMSTYSASNHSTSQGGYPRYDGVRSPDHGRVSPGPSIAYGGGGRQSPGPGAAYGGRQSPGPGAAYGGGRQSPGPAGAYETFRSQ